MNQLSNFISQTTANRFAVVEFGSMFFNRLSIVHPTVLHKIGIEIWEPYIKASKFKQCTMILGDMTKFEELVDPKFYDCAMFIDTIEHIEKEVGLDLIDRVQRKFNKIIMMCPSGEHIQENDPTGYGAHESQTHKSTWFLSEFQKLGFVGNTIKDYHSPRPGITRDCIFCVWDKK